MVAAGSESKASKARTRILRWALLLAVLALVWVYLRFEVARDVQFAVPPQTEPSIAVEGLLPMTTPEAPVELFGEKSPKETVLRVIGVLKDTLNPTKILDYVWWESAYRKLTPIQKKYLFVSSADGLRRYYQAFFTNPNFLIVREAAKRIENLPQAERQKFIDFFKTQESANVPPPPYGRVLNQYFEIKAERNSGGSAEVDLLVTEAGRSTLQTIRLLKIQDRWMLECFQVMEDPLHLCSQQNS